MRSTRPLRLALAAALLALAPAPARALAQETTTTSAPAVAQPQVATAPAASAQPSGLPVQGGPPRTLRAYWHVYAAFTIAWLLVFGYAISLGRRFGRLEREVNARAAS